MSEFKLKRARGISSPKHVVFVCSKASSATRSARLISYICSAYVAGRRLTFDKASKDGAAKYDCEYTGNATDRVYGVVFEIHASDRAALDRAEGKGYGYDALVIEVTAPTGPAVILTYIATNKKAGLRPYDWYKQHVLDGASAANLPGDYISMIADVESIPDSDDARSARENAIRC